MYSADVRKKARDLFVDDGLSYEEVARETGVSLNNLKKWGIAGKWTKERELSQRAFEALNGKVARGKMLVMDAILDLYQNPEKKFQSQEAYAHNDTLRSLNSFNRGNTNTAIDKPALFIEFLTKLTEHLKEKDPDSLKYLEPHIRGFAESIKEAG